MRALLSVVGTRGDVQPVLALALEVRALGLPKPRGAGGVVTLVVLTAATIPDAMRSAVVGLLQPAERPKAPADGHG